MNLEWKGASDPQNLTEPFFAFSKGHYDAKEVIHQRISWNPENISKSRAQCQKIKKCESLMKRCIGSAKPQRTGFRFFDRYYDAKELIHKRISWNWENISKSGPKIRPKIVKNWIFNEKVHRIRKTSQNRFFAFSKDITMLKKWFISLFPEIEKISQNLGPKLGHKLKKNWIFNEKVHRTRKTSQNRFSLFRKILRC